MPSLPFVCGSTPAGWRAMEEWRCEWWREIKAYLFADRTKERLTYDSYWWCAKRIHFCEKKKTGSLRTPMIPCWLETHIYQIWSLIDVFYQVRHCNIFGNQMQVATLPANSLMHEIPQWSKLTAAQSGVFWHTGAQYVILAALQRGGRV